MTLSSFHTKLIFMKSVSVFCIFLPVVLLSRVCEGDELFSPAQVDPMFQRMASSFDESSTAGVFLSVLFSENSRCELLFPSHMTLLQSRPSYSPPPPQGVPASPFMGKTHLPSPKMHLYASLGRTEDWNTLPNIIETFPQQKFLPPVFLCRFF